MNKDTNVNLEYLKAVSGKFDLETIFNLDLNGKSISKIGAMSQCSNLVFLNLKSNKLSNLTGLCLNQLVMLDLSFNMITNLDTLDEMSKLKYLKLQGNKIDKFKSITKLKSFKSLENVLLQEVNGNAANPICKLENYRNEVFSIAPSLKSLDSIRRECEPLSINQESITIDLSKLDKNNFDFNIKEKIELNVEKSMKDLSYSQFSEQLGKRSSEFIKQINEMKNSVKNMK